MNDADRRPLFRTIRRALEERLSSLGHAVAREEEELRARLADEDAARDAPHEETELALLELGEAELGQLHAALGRLRDGTYGACATCGRDIPAARLRALPVASRCVDCERASERRRR